MKSETRCGEVVGRLIYSSHLLYQERIRLALNDLTGPAFFKVNKDSADLR